jgi:hypothetical protein
MQKTSSGKAGLTGDPDEALRMTYSLHILQGLCVQSCVTAVLCMFLLPAAATTVRPRLMPCWRCLPVARHGALQQ